MASPFEGGGDWLRCALHAHTTESDGDLPPAELAAAYAAAGFDVLAITDHWRLTAAPPVDGLVTIRAAELSCDLGTVGRVADVLVYGLAEVPDDPGGDRRNWLVNEAENWEQRTFPSLAATASFARDQGAAAFVAHPYWTGLDHGEVLAGDGLAGLEVFNASAENESGRGDSSSVWDAVLESGRRLGAIAADDAHVADDDVGHAWTWVRAAARTPAAVVEALGAGRAYASTGPRIDDVRRNGDEVEIACSPCRLLVLQMERENGCAVTAARGDRQPYGDVLERDPQGLITRAVLRPATQPAYLRVRVVDGAGRTAWTNPL